MTSKYISMTFCNRLPISAICAVLVFCCAAAVRAQVAGDSLRKPAAVFDSQGNMTINAKPAFPLGIYVALYPSWVHTQPKKLTAKLNDLEHSPFNFLINYGSRKGTEEQFKQYYHDLYKHGLVEFAGVKALYKQIGNPRMQIQFKGSEKQALHHFVSISKGLKGIAGWYIADEIPLETNEIQRHNQWIQKWDPNRPTLVVTSQNKTSKIRGYAQSGDIVAIDRYPIPHGSVQQVADAMEHLREASGNNQPKWFVLQTFGNYVYYPKYRNKGIRTRALRPKNLRRSLRAPTAKEMRAMAYLALVHGATGLVAYYYRDINLSFDAATRWKAVKDIFRDVKQISPILLAPDAKIGKMRGDNLDIQWTVKQMNDKLYLIAVNTTRQLQSIRLWNLPRTIHHVKVIQGLGYADGSGTYGGLVLILDSLNTIVVQID